MIYNPNKRKNIYDPNSYTGQQINNQIDIANKVVQPLAKLADKNPEVKGARLGLSALGTATTRLASDAGRTKKYSNIINGRIANNQDEAVGFGFKPAATMPKVGPATYPKTTLASISNSNQPVTDTSLVTINDKPNITLQDERNKRRYLSEVAKNIQNVSRNNPIQVGNMDVTFAPGTDQEARERFLQNPVAENQRGYLVGYQGKLSDLPYESITGKSNRGGGLASLLLTKDNAPDVGWQTRKALNQAIIAGEYDAANNVMRNNVELANINATSKNAAANRLEESRRIDSDIALNNAKISESELNTRALRNLLDAEPGSEAYNKAIKDYMFINGKQEKETKRDIHKMKETVIGPDGQPLIGPDGTVVTREFLAEPTERGFRRLSEDQGISQESFEVPTQATIELMKSLRDNKEAESIYLKRFGKLPY